MNLTKNISWVYIAFNPSWWPTAGPPRADDTNRFVAEETQNYLNDIYKEAENQNFGPNDYLSDAMDPIGDGGPGPGEIGRPRGIGEDDFKPPLKD
ncbi:MAG: hypothetical protein ACNS63_06085 [Candidatus Nitrospinota bacterium M3_3B_026]